jgi:hypothetical protein
MEGFKILGWQSEQQWPKTAQRLLITSRTTLSPFSDEALYFCEA